MKASMRNRVLTVILFAAFVVTFVDLFYHTIVLQDFEVLMTETE